MREGEASRTATGVALLRAIAHRAGLHGMRDPIAESLLPRRLSRALRVLGRAPSLARWLSGGLLDHIALRTAAIDHHLRAALAEGATQVVILGAGLDARAWRVPELASVVVFEVDVAASQRVKRRKTAPLRTCAREVRFVEVDFARGELDSKLDAAGHDRTARTAWIWEGVTAYLSRDAIDATLRTIAARSATGSVLLVTYVTPEHVRLPRALIGPVRTLFELAGEPLLGPIATRELASLLESHGFAIEHDLGSPDWGLSPVSRPVLDITERLAVARFRAPRGLELTP